MMNLNHIMISFLIIEDDIRNHLIVDDVISCIKENRNFLIISERVSHITVLAELIKKEYKDVIVLVGGKNNKKNCELLNLIDDTPKNKLLVILATGKYICEGFDEARLDTLFFNDANFF